MANHSGDNITYERHYQTVGYEASDYIWNFLMTCGNFLRLDFYQFKAIITIIALVMIFYALKDETTNLYYVILMYAMSFVFMDSQVLRNFLAMSVLLFSVRYLKDIQNRKNFFKYIICIVIATGIHKSFMIYIILLLLLLKNEKSFRWIIAFLGISLLGITIISGEIPFLDDILQYIDLGDKRSVFETRTGYGGIPVILIHLYTIFIIKNLCERLKNRYTKEQLNFYNTVYFIDICMITILPLLLLNLNFYRLIKNVTLLNYAVLANAFSNYKNASSKFIVFMATAILAIAWFIFETNIFGNMEDVVFTVLNP